MHDLKRSWGALAVCALAACSKREAEAPPAAQTPTEFARVDTARIANANAEPQNRFTTGRNFGEERFSPLDQVNVETVTTDLGFAWQYDLIDTAYAVRERKE